MALFSGTVFDDVETPSDDAVRLARAVRNVDFEHRKLRDRLAAARGLSLAEFNAVVIVVQSKGTLTPKELTDYLTLTASSITAVVDRLERLQLIVRAPNPRDRRSSLLVPLAAGIALSDEVSTLYVRSFERVIAEHCRSHPELMGLIGQLECLADAVASADASVQSQPEPSA